VYEETLTGRPHDISVQKATSDNENVDAVLRQRTVARLITSLLLEATNKVIETSRVN